VTRLPGSKYDYVTRKELAELLGKWAKAADTSLTVKMREMETRLVAQILQAQQVAVSDTPVQLPDSGEDEQC